MKLSKYLNITAFVVSVSALFVVMILPTTYRQQAITAMSEFVDLQPTLYGGRPIKTGELKPSVYIGNCTATVVGPETIITAGHCRSTNSSVSFTVDRVKYSGKCKRHPDYSKNGWLNNDFALCKFAPKIDLDVWGSLKPITLKSGDMITMQGYGRGSNGRLNVGYEEIKKVNYMDYITSGSVYLGGGDSGGALFTKIDDLVKGPFYVVGINSRGGGKTSYFNITALDRSQDWFKKYASDEDVEICGLNKNCGEDGNPPPKPSECAEEHDLVRYFEEELNAAKDQLQACSLD